MTIGKIGKDIKKSVALTLILAMLLGLGVPFNVFAEEEPATDNEIYGMLYYADTNKLNTDGSITESKNIELVLQKGKQPDDNKRLVVDSDGNKGIVKYSKVDAYPSWYKFAPTSNNYNIVKVDFKDKLQPTSIAGWFRNCKLLGNNDFLHKDNLDTSECTNMQYAFYLCQGLKSIDFKEWTNFTVSEVQNLSYFMADCSSVTTADITTFHPAKCSEAQHMFRGCSSLKKLALDNFNITTQAKKNVYLNNFFQNCKSLVSVGNNDSDSINLSEFKATKPMSYDSMFRGCSKLVKADLSALGLVNTNRSVYISHMFYDCVALEEVDMTNFKIEFSPRNFFVNCRALRDLRVPDASTTNNLGKNESKDLFKYADKLAYVEISSAWRPNAGLAYLPVSADTVWIKTKGGTADCPLDTEKTSAELFNNFNASYAGGWSTKQTFEFRGNGGNPDYQYVEGHMGQPLDITGLTSPTRTGYDFAGWYSQPDGGDEFKSGDTANRWTYYAKWTDHKYTLKLNANGGHIPDSTETLKSVTLDYSEWAELSGDTFVKNNGDVLVGWNTASNGSGTSYSAYDSVSMLTNVNGGEVTLYALWNKNEATVEFESQGGSEADDKNYNNLPKNYGVLSESWRDGYTFLGWYTAAEGGEKIEENSPVTGDITLYAHWAENPKITLDANGGTFKLDDEHTTDIVTEYCGYNKPIGRLPSPTNTAASFLGWYTEAEGGEKISSDTVLTSDTTYYAHWGYRPSLDTDGGNIQGDFEGFEASSTADYKITELPEVERDNYTFKGWYNGETKVEEGSTIDLNENNVIKAKWDRAAYVTVTLNTDDGTLSDGVSNTIKIYKGKSVAELPAPEKEGYDFEGWFRAGSSERETASSIYDSDITLTAHWAQLNCTVTFHPGKGTIIGDDVVKVASGKVMDYVPGIYNPAVGESFVGWYTQPDGKGSRLLPTTVITGDVDYYPFWDAQINIDNDTNVNFLAHWNNISDSNVTDIGNYLVFHPANNGEVSASLKIVLMMEGVAGSKPVPTGTLKLKIPKYVFKNYNNQPIMKNNIGAAASENYDIDSLSDPDYYILTNKRELKSVFDTFIINYTANPREIKGGYIDENYMYQGDYFKNENIKVILDIDKNGNGRFTDQDDKTYQQDLGLEFHTTVFTKAAKARSNVTMEWNESWGTRPVDYDDYFYVTWALTSDHSANSTQRFKLLWDEDTYGKDGNIVYTSGAVSYNEETSDRWTGYKSSGRYTSYVVTKHRRDGATTVHGDKWVTVNNEAVLNVKYESGYEEQFRVSATATAYIPPSGNGSYSFTKTVPNNNNNESHFIRGGQELILNGEADNMPKLPYEIKYSENYNLDNPGWNESTNEYSAKNRTMTITDGIVDQDYSDSDDPTDVMISTCSSNLSEDKWENSHGLMDGDYYFDKLTINLTEYNAAKLGDTQWSNPYEHTNRNDYKPVKIFIRKENSSEFIFHKEVSIPKSGLTESLPENTAGFKLVHESSAYTTGLSVKTNICLKPTARLAQYVRDAVNDGKYTIIKNKAEINVKTDSSNRTYFTNANGSTWPSSYVLDMSSINLYARKDCADKDNVKYDASTMTEVFPVVVSGWNYNNSGNKTLFKTGEFYDLLPKDFSVDKDSVYVKPILENWSESYYKNTAKVAAKNYDREIKSGTLPKGSYSVQFIENWNDTRCTMMIIKINVPDSIPATGVNVYYKMKTRYASIYVNGATQSNIAVFKDTTDGQIKPENKSTGINEGSVPSELISAFTELDGDHTAFASDNTDCIVPPVRESGLTSSVHSENSELTSHETVGLNSDYSYHIVYDSGASSVSEDLVFYDVIEKRIGGEDSEWYGKFLGVDVSALETVENQEDHNAKCAPVVYYSTQPKSQFYINDYGQDIDSFNVDDSSIWTTTPPDDLSKVTAIAVDCRKDNKNNDFKLKPEGSMDFKINMKSVNDKTKNNTYTYNESIIRYTLSDTQDRVHLRTQTDVLLHYSNPRIEKTAFPSSGTAEAPESVVKNSELEYKISITNPDDTMSMTDLTITDSLNGALVKPSGDIRVSIGDEEETVIGKHVRIKSSELLKDNSAYNFNAVVSTLEPNETIHIIIPVTVIGEKNSIIENSAEITTVNGTDFNIKSDTTYHVVDDIKVKVFKVNSKGDALSGAKLKILNDNEGETQADYYNSNNIRVGEFTSTNKPLSFSIAAGKYILRETETPAGDYKKADDIHFTVGSDGHIYIGDKVTDVVKIVNEPSYKVIFHENNPEIEDKNVVFKVYEPTDLDSNKRISHFYDIPDFAGDEYVFAGWYHNAGYTESTEGISVAADFEADKYEKPDPIKDYHLYAKWIKVGTVEKADEDKNIINGGYRGFGLAGVQIRPEEWYDPNIRDGDETASQYNDSAKVVPGGLRFVTSLSENLLGEINAIDKIDSSSSEAKSFGVEYGYVVATQQNINSFKDNYKFDDEDYKLQYKGVNVNGVNTTGEERTAKTDFRYVSNVDCTSKEAPNKGSARNKGVVKWDHRNFGDYRLYTLVVTYEGDSSTKKSDRLDARAYIRYYDANGKLRVFYNNYKKNMYFGGCMCSFNQVSAMSIPTTSE